jgi:hypothetical protein
MTVRWVQSPQGGPLPIFSDGTNAWASPGTVLSPVTGAVPMAAVLDNIQNFPGQSDLIASLLLDAQVHVMDCRISDALILIGTAFEIAFTDYSRRSDSAFGRKIKEILRGRDRSFAEKRYHLVPLLISQRSLKDEDLKTFEDVEKAYRVRNAIVHECRCILIENGVETELDQAIVARFLASAERATEWIKNL